MSLQRISAVKNGSASYQIASQANQLE